MTTTTALPPVGRRLGVMPIGWWLVLGVVLFLAIRVWWVTGVTVLLFALIQRARPFDFLTSFLTVAAVASFTDYISGHLTTQMWILTALLGFSLLCYTLSRRRDSLVIPDTVALRPLLLFLALTFVNFVRGLALGHAPSYAGLELMAALGFASCLIVGSRPLEEREMLYAMAWLWIVGLGHFALGTYSYAINHIRAAGVFFEPVTGIIAVLMFNFALREPRKSRMALWVLAMAPLLFHQFLSFTRGFWLALAVSLPFSVLVYAGRGAGSGARWRQSAAVLGMLMLLGVIGIVAMASALGMTDIGAVAAGRVASSFETEYDTASLSNFVRYAEYLHVIESIIAKPWFGYGIGYSFVVRETIGFHLVKQWYVHDNYLLVWLKQGIIGLALWIWLLFACLRATLRGRSLPNRVAQSWATGTAAIVVYLIVYQLVHFPLAEVNSVFIFALTLGVTMGLTRRGTIALRWRAGHSPQAAR